MNIRKLFLRAVYCALIPAAGLAATAMYAGWQLNSQQEFHGADHSSLGFWILMGLSWFVRGFLVSGLLFFILFVTIAWAQRRGRPLRRGR